MTWTFTDFFCGFGGSSIGLTEAGGELVWAANHWDRAIETHALNFRDADHFQGDISGYDMRRVPRADVAWMSPECTWHSPAGGRKKVRVDLDLFDDYVPDAAGERSRATMWDVVRAAEAKQFKILIVENVVEVTTWPLFETWLSGMEVLGYSYQILCVSAAHIGGDRNPHAPQWRDRIYFIFARKGVLVPDVQPHPLAWCAQCDAVVESTQSWKRTDRRRIGKYGPQYVYVCAAGRHPQHVVEPYVLPAAAAIDWSDLGTRIGDRERPLAPATIRRIEAGLRMFARPILAAAAGQTWDGASEGASGNYLRAVPADGSPLWARTGTAGDGVAVPPFVVNTRHGEDDGGRQFDPVERPFPTAQTKIGDGFVVPVGGTWRNEPRSLEEPLPTRTTADDLGLVASPFMVERRDFDGPDATRLSGTDEPFKTMTTSGTIHTMVTPPFIAELRGTSTARSTEEPLGAITAGGLHHGLTVPPGAFVTRQYGQRGAVEHLATSIEEPLHPITASGGNHALVIPYRRGARAQRADASPLSTMATHAQTGLLDPSIDVDDCRFRMLGPREHLRAQRFPDTYLVLGNKSEQTKGAGNAVASNVAHYLGVIVGRALGTPQERAA